MSKPGFCSILGRLSFVIVLAAFLSGAPAMADVIYLVSVNTSAINGVAGNLDFQFNPGTASSQAAFVSILSFSSAGGILTGPPATLGDVTGTLPATVRINNTTALNDYFHPFTYGASFQFQLLLGGPAIQSPNGTATSGSKFALSLFDSLGANTFLTTDPNGFAATADINLNGTVTTSVFPSNPRGGAPVVTFSVAGVPEPSTFSFVSGSLLAIAGAVALRRKLTDGRLSNRH